MGYVNLSIYVGKTSKKFSGQKNFYGPVQDLLKLKKRKNSHSSKSGIIYFALGTKMKRLTPKWH